MWLASYMVDFCIWYKTPIAAILVSQIEKQWSGHVKVAK